MYTLMLVIQFDGSGFYGFQRLTDPDKPTIQEVFENKLLHLLGHKVGIYGSGRTDRGVHALAARISFKVKDDRIPPEGVVRMLRDVLPDAINITRWERVHNKYHPLSGITSKSYSYYMIFGRKIKTFYRNYIWNVMHDLNVDDMKDAASVFVGTKDFGSFSNGYYPPERRVKTIHRVRIMKVPGVNRGLVVRVSGSGFLHRMVRRMVGALVEVGQGRLTKDDLELILKDRNLKSSYKIAPAAGLYMARIKY